ncbi:MAG: carboxypeptidase regulatory-like domain-containing protein, partial [Clostridia bacterium]|nr:carboxypeptidase regulatory-like domain-containing protein [Clostridia bacterium]
PLTIAPNPDASETLTGYTLTSTLAGVANRDIPTALYKDGKKLYSVNGYYWLTNAEGITADPGWSFSSSYPDYDSEGAVNVNGTQITVDYPKLAQTAQLTGTVKNTASEPVANAAVVANVNINGTTVTYNTVAAKDGSYTISNMYNGKTAAITAWADGYEEGSKTVTLNNTATADITLSPTSSITVTVGDGQSVTKPEFTVYDSSDNTVTSHRFTSGSRFTLVLPSSASNAEGTAYKVKMTSEDTSGTATGTAAFGADKSASVSLTPERLGYIDWGKVDGTDFRVLVYEGDSFYKSCEAAEQQCVVPAGEYTVYLSKNYSKQDEDPSETVTVEAGKTAQLTIEPPKSEKFVVASANGPKTAEKGKYYEISGVIESETDAQGRQFYGLDASVSGGVTVLGYKINGSYVGLSDTDGRSGWAKVNKYYAPSEYPYVDWSFPLSYTLYVRQNADFGDNQSVTMYACYSESSSSYAATNVTIGTVITKSVPGITITCPEVLGAKTVKTDTDGDTLVPNDLDFSGTAPSNAYVKIYDNDTLIAIAKADANGNYSSRASLDSAYRSHTLRAEADTDLGGEDTVISAEKSCTYSPTGPVLTGLWLNGGRLSITGGMTAYNPNRSSNYAGYSYEASFENDNRLADITVDDISSEPTEGGERVQMTGKVFFIVSTSTGSYTLKAEKKQSGFWTATSALGGSDPLDVKVMYEEKDDLTAPTVTLTDVNNGHAQVEITPDNAYAVKLKDGETVDWSDKADLLEALGISEGEAVTDDTADTDPDYTWIPDDTDYELPSADTDRAEKVRGLDDYFTLMSSAKSTSDL